MSQPIEVSDRSSLSLSEQHDVLFEGFMNAASDKLEHFDMGAISAAMISATARFGAFYIASASESRKDLKEDKEDTILKFSQELKRELAIQLDDYIENYKVYMREGEEES